MKRGLPLAVLLMLGTAFCYYAWIAFRIFPSVPGSFDEYGYFYQARIFAQGHAAITNDSPLLLEPHMLFHHGRIFSKYPPGFSLLLAPFAALGMEKLANPLLMALGLAFVYRMLRSFLAGKSAAAVTLLAAFSPYVFGYAASFYAQPLAFFLSAGAAWAFLRNRETGQEKYLLYSMAFCFYGMFSRPLDMFCLLAAFALSTLLEEKPRRAARKILAYGLSAVTGLAMLAGYTSWQMGEFALTGYSNLFSGAFYIMPEGDGGVPARLLKALSQYAVNAATILPILFMQYFAPLAGGVNIALVAIGMAGSVRLRGLRVFVFHVVLLVAAYNFHRSDGWPQYGARYWFSFLPSLIVLAGAGFQLLERGARRIIRRPQAGAVAGIMLVLYNVYWIGTVTPPLLATYGQRFRLTETARENMRTMCPEKSIVLLSPHIPHPVVEKDRFIEDDILINNSFSDGKYFMLRDSSCNGADDQACLNRKRAIETKLRHKYPDYALCRYRIDYRSHGRDRFQ